MQLQTHLMYKGKVQLSMFKFVPANPEPDSQIICVSTERQTPHFGTASNQLKQYLNDYDSAIAFIDNYHPESTTASPVAILIDTPLNQLALEKLHLSIRDKGLNKLSVIYNAKHLTERQAKILKHLGLIDESVSFEPDKLIIALLNKEEKKNILLVAGQAVKQVVNKEKIRTTGYFFKRLFDSFIALCILLVLMPVFILVALAIRLESKGPIFYASPRAGRGYKIFKFYKFRSMVVDADKKVQAMMHLNQYSSNTNNGAVFFKVANDPRITRVGRFLRNTSLDELPQLFNVIKGDMSLVGNRPLPLYEAETLVTDDYVERFMAPAGITGLWQVEKRGKPEMSIDERISLDISYARKASPLLDFKILFSTPFALLQKSDV